MQVLAVYGSWHLGQLQVGLSRAVRLAQCRSLQLTAQAAMPMQIDGEPWFQAPASISVKLQGKVSCDSQLQDLRSAVGLVKLQLHDQRQAAGQGELCRSTA